MSQPKFEIRELFVGDDEWPAEAFGQYAAVMPTKLYVRGNASLAELTGKAMSVAIVGARAATMYGEQVARDLAHEFSQKSVTVVSGGAYGIDNAAHRGTLTEHGPSVMVLANGLNTVYPLGHTTLADSVLANGGLLVSEQPPPRAPDRSAFLARNRIIAALSHGVVIVEAGLRSGSMDTAEWAARLRRPVYAVPGPVTSAVSVGTHKLIRTGRARLITNALDVLSDHAFLAGVR